MEKLLSLFDFKPMIERVYYSNKYFVTSQNTSLLQAEDNVRVLENITGLTKLISSLRAEIKWLKNENEELYQENQKLISNV